LEAGVETRVSRLPMAQLGAWPAAIEASKPPSAIPSRKRGRHERHAELSKPKRQTSP
jgi:hypothetical protein